VDIVTAPPGPLFDKPEDKNALAPIFVSVEVGVNVTVVKSVQEVNAPAPMIVTEAGIVIDGKFPHNWNALAPIV
jgi:hypothetical protein